MDLLDLLKLMVRRWYVTLPVLLAAVTGTVIVGQQIRPEYKTSAAIVLVPPTTAAPEPAAGSSPKPGNPWLQVGNAEMAQAIQIVAMSARVRTAVLAAGGEPGYEVTVQPRSSILTIEVTAATSDRALATVTAVTKLIGNEVAARQAEYKPRPGEQITTAVLDPGLDIDQSRSNVLRAQIVLLVIGLLLAAVCAVVTDAVTRRLAAGRSRRRSVDRVSPLLAGQATVRRQPPAGALAPPPGRYAALPEPAGRWGAASPVHPPVADDTIVLSATQRPGRDAG